MVSIFPGILFISSVRPSGRQMTDPDLDGKSHPYRLNGFTLFLLTVGVSGFTQIFGGFSLSALCTHFASLFIVANRLAFALSRWLYYPAIRNLKAQASPGIFRGCSLIWSAIQPCPESI